MTPCVDAIRRCVKLRHKPPWRRTLHKTMFHTTLTSNVRQSAGAVPSSTAVKCSNASPVAKPADAGMAFAITAAVATPLMRRWRMRPVPDSAIGNRARLPESTGPSLALRPTTAATRIHASSTRNKTSYQRCSLGGIVPWQKRSASGTHRPNVTRVSMMTPANVQVSDPARTASTIHVAKAAAKLAAIPCR